MTYTVSLLYWLSAGLYDVLTLITTGSTITLHPALLVDSSTVLFSRQVLLTQQRLALSLAPAASKQLGPLLPLALSASLGCTALQLPPPAQQGLAELPLQ